MRNTIIALLAVAALAGCSGETPAAQQTPSPTPSPTPSVTPVTSPSPATLTREQAGRKYLAMIKPVNAVYDRADCTAAEDYMVNGGSWDRTKYSYEHADQILRVCYKQLIPLYTTQIQTLQSTPWPADAKQDIVDLVSLNQAFVHCLRQAVKGSTAQQMYTALECFPPDDGSADRVRARFGLPGRSN